MNFNFELILFYATLVTGLVALIDLLFFARKRKTKGVIKLPLIFDYARSFFPILLIVFLIRSFLYEPFRIPSGSLEPTLLTGDFILVNKFDYGVRLPVIHTKIWNISEPQRGDIMVFRWPPDPSIDFIKRVIGVPGDKITYINKQLSINGNKIPIEFEKKVQARDANGFEHEVSLALENLNGLKHSIYIDPEKVSEDYYDIIVPEHHYFMMGDNRDDSADSRVWGLVPEENIIGKAVLVWMSWSAHDYKIRWNRIGKRI